MSERYETLASKIDGRFGEQLSGVPSTCGELTYEVDKDDLIEVATALRNEADFGFEMLMDVCGVDYLNYGSDEWKTNDATDSGYSRGVEREPVILDEADEFDPRRFRGCLSPAIAATQLSDFDYGLLRAQIIRRY